MTDDESPPREALRAALFVDFDNTFINLQKLDQKAAEAFASSPSRWLDWLEQGLDSGTPRRFLIRNVYLNPASFGAYRAVYTRTGFRAIDCPALTSQGKNSADIYMVLDIVDALQSGQHYDEFIIASADADFTPVLHRLRAHDRRTTLLLAGQSAAAYRAVCDSLIAPEVLADVALGQEVSPPEEAQLGGAPSLLVQPTQLARSAAQGAARERPERDVEAVANAVRSAVAAAERPSSVRQRHRRL